MQRHHYKAEGGITLIELIVTIAIVSCLTMIALPTFSHVYKEHRLSYAKSTLLGIQLKLDKYLSINQVYPASLDEIKGIDMENSYFQFELVKEEACSNVYCYILTAQPQNKSRSDEVLQLHSNGYREGNW